jgi:hypothetical protein
MYFVQSKSSRNGIELQWWDIWQSLPNDIQSVTLAHKHLLHRFCHCWRHRRKASFRIFRSSAVAFDLCPPWLRSMSPLKPISRGGNSQKSLVARSGEHGGWVMTQQAMSGSVRYPDAETTVPPCLPLVTPLPPNCIAQSL